MPRRSRAPRPQLLLWMLLLASQTATASLDAGPRVEVVWTEDAPEIDGRIDEEVWKTAAVIDDFHTAVPEIAGTPSQRTVVRILSDRDALYFAVECYDDRPDEIVANHMLRDDVDTYWDDRVNFVIDPFLSRRNGYFFQVNPVGVRRDGLVEGPNFEPNWDGIWTAKARTTHEGWFAEVRLPYKTIGFDPKATSWGFNFSRGIRRNNEDIRWADPYPQRIVTNMSTAGYLDGMGRQQQGIGLDVVPYATTRRIDDRFRDKHYFKFDPQLDAFYRITPSLTGSLTVNTDFGETEVDDQQINLDRFALFFPEKRDFFLQDALIFDFGALSANVEGVDPNGRPFFSRKIGLDADGDPVDIRAAGKVTGRVGPFNVGLLDAQLASHTLRKIDRLGRPSPFRTQDDPIDATNVFVGRATMNVLGESRVGMIVTNGDPQSDRDNTLVGADFDYRDSNFLGSGDVLQGNLWFQNSFTQGEDGAEAAWGAELQYPNDKHFVFLNFRDLNADFYPALGFVNRTGIRRYEARYRYRIRPQDEVVRTIDPFVYGLLVTDRSNEVQSGALLLRPIALEAHVGGTIQVTYKRGFERVLTPFRITPRAAIPIGSYDTDELIVELEAGRHRRLYGYIEVRYGDFFSGRRVGVTWKAEWRPSRYVRLGLEYIHNKLWLDSLDDPTSPLTSTVSRVETRTRVARVRINLQFTPDIAWLTFVQYDNLSDQVGVNSRLRWIIEDGREVFLVFNQLLLSEDGNVQNVRTEPLAKVGWTFRF